MTFQPRKDSRIGFQRSTTAQGSCRRVKNGGFTTDATSLSWITSRERDYGGDRYTGFSGRIAGSSQSSWNRAKSTSSHSKRATDGKPAEYVSCFGSSTIREELVKKYGSPFAVETAHIKFQGTDVNARIIRSLSDTARQYRESIDFYGDKASVEWPLIEHESALLGGAIVKLPTFTL